MNRHMVTICVRLWVLFSLAIGGLATVFGQAALACVICLPYPKATHADALMASEVVVLAREDPDRLAIKTGLGIKKAKLVQMGAVTFLERDAPAIEHARRRAAEQATE